MTHMVSVRDINFVINDLPASERKVHWTFSSILFVCRFDSQQRFDEKFTRCEQSQRSMKQYVPLNPPTDSLGTAAANKPFENKTRKNSYTQKQRVSESDR